MSFPLQARMGLFQFTKNAFVHVPNTPIDLRSVFGPQFPTAPHGMATINWVTDPQLGFPVAPFIVRVARSPLGLSEYGARSPGFSLTASNGFFISLAAIAWSPALRLRGATGALCITAKCQADSNTVIYATNLIGEEIPETRQSANAPAGTAFLGPDIFGLRATGPVALTEIAAFAAIRDPENMATLAEVAPPFPTVPYYQDQSYLGAKLSAQRALETRLLADALARENTDAPTPQPLTELHRRNPFPYASEILGQEFVTQSKQNITRLLGSSDWSYSSQLPGAPQSKMELHPARLWQYLSLSGPIEAATLGQSISVPIEFGFLAQNA